MPWRLGSQAERLRVADPDQEVALSDYLVQHDVLEEMDVAPSLVFEEDRSSAIVVSPST
jgi:hypothetical protein